MRLVVVAGFQTAGSRYRLASKVEVHWSPPAAVADVPAVAPPLAVGQTSPCLSETGFQAKHSAAPDGDGTTVPLPPLASKPAELVSHSHTVPSASSIP